MKTGLQRVGKGVAWFFTVWLALFGVVSMPSFASVLFYVAAIALLPVQAWQNILKTYIPYFRKWKVLSVVVLFFAAILMMPESERATESAESAVSEVTITESTAESPEVESEMNSEEAAVSDENLQEAKKSRFSVQFIDVGQADAALIECDGHWMMIDGGNKTDSDKIYTILKNAGVSKLDIVVGSHAHEDHIGGLSAVYNLADVGLTLCPVMSYDSESFKDFVRYAGTITIPKIGDSYPLGSAEVTVLGLNAGVEDNDTSIILRIAYGETAFLFAGDAGESAERAVLGSGVDLSASVLKVAHHGSESGTTHSFLKEVSPQYAVISVGKENEYGHPEEKLLNRISFNNIELYRTDLHGDITMTSDGRNVTVSTEKNADAIDLWESPEGSEQVIPLSPVQPPETSSKPVRVVESETIPDITPETIPESTSESMLEPEPTGTDYVGNLNSKKFHYAWCDSVDKMKESNKYYFNGTRDQMIAKGYDPCGNCHP